MAEQLVGVIGCGPVGTAIAGHLVASGVPVVLGTRHPAVAALTASSLGPLARAGSVNQAAAAGLVVLAIPHRSVADVGTRVGDWTGRTVIDATNGPAGGSVWVARHLPGAAVVKALNAMRLDRLAESPVQPEGRRIAFLAGDDPVANARVAALLEHCGFAPVPVGSLAAGAVLLDPGGYLSGVDLIRLDG